MVLPNMYIVYIICRSLANCTPIRFRTSSTDLNIQIVGGFKERAKGCTIKAYKDDSIENHFTLTGIGINTESVCRNSPNQDEL